MENLSISIQCDWSSRCPNPSPPHRAAVTAATWATCSENSDQWSVNSCFADPLALSRKKEKLSASCRGLFYLGKTAAPECPDETAPLVSLCRL